MEKFGEEFMLRFLERQQAARFKPSYSWAWKVGLRFPVISAHLGYSFETDLPFFTVQPEELAILLENIAHVNRSTSNAREKFKSHW